MLVWSYWSCLHKIKNIYNITKWYLFTIYFNVGTSWFMYQIPGSDMSKIINFIYLKPLFSLSPMKFQIRSFHSKLIIRIFQINFIIFIAVRDMYKPKLTTSKILADLSSDIVQQSSPLSLIPRSSILPVQNKTQNHQT